MKPWIFLDLMLFRSWFTESSWCLKKSIILVSGQPSYVRKTWNKTLLKSQLMYVAFCLGKFSFFYNKDEIFRKFQPWPTEFVTKYGKEWKRYFESRILFLL